MQVTLKATTFNEIMTFASKFTTKDNSRPVLSQILLELEDKKLTATALDGYKMGQLTFYDVDGEEGSMIIPPIKKVKVKTEPYVTITDDGENIIFETVTKTQSFKRFDGKFFNYKPVFPEREPKEIFSMTAGNIAKALSAFDKDTIIDIEYREKHLPVIVTDRKKAIALVMPVRRKE